MELLWLHKDFSKKHNTYIHIISIFSILYFTNIGIGVFVKCLLWIFVFIVCTTCAWAEPEVVMLTVKKDVLLQATNALEQEAEKLISEKKTEEQLEEKTEKNQKQELKKYETQREDIKKTIKYIDDQLKKVEEKIKEIMQQE